MHSRCHSLIWHFSSKLDLFLAHLQDRLLPDEFLHGPKLEVIPVVRELFSLLRYHIECWSTLRRHQLFTISHQGRRCLFVLGLTQRNELWYFLREVLDAGIGRDRGFVLLRELRRDSKLRKLATQWLLDVHRVIVISLAISDLTFLDGVLSRTYHGEEALVDLRSLYDHWLGDSSRVIL